MIDIGLAGWYEGSHFHFTSTVFGSNLLFVNQDEELGLMFNADTMTLPALTPRVKKKAAKHTRTIYDGLLPNIVPIRLFISISIRNCLPPRSVLQFQKLYSISVYCSCFGRLLKRLETTDSSVCLTCVLLKRLTLCV